MTDQKNTFKPDYLCDNPICRDSAIEQLEGRKEDADEIERLRAALKPSAGTKAAYMGEFQFGLPGLDEDGNLCNEGLCVYSATEHPLDL